jgi:hypothetical protein
VISSIGLFKAETFYLGMQAFWYCIKFMDDAGHLSG